MLEHLPVIGARFRGAPPAPDDPFASSPSAPDATRARPRGKGEKPFSAPSFHLEEAEVEEIFARGRETIIDRISPARVEQDLSYYRIDEYYYTTLAISRWPAPDKIVAANVIFGLGLFPESRFTIHHHAIPNLIASQHLRRMLSKQEAEIISLAEKQRSDIKLEQRAEETRQAFERIERGDAKYFHVSAYLRLRGKTRNELRQKVNEVKNLIIANGCKFRELPGQQLEALAATLPYADDQVYQSVSFQSTAAVNLFPFLTRQIYTSNGILYGVHAHNFTPIVDSPLSDMTNPEVLAVIGNRGSGKSFWIRLFMGRLAMQGVQLLVIDPLADFVRWFEVNKGQIVTIHPDSPFHINPLRLTHYSDGTIEQAANKIARLAPLFRLLLGDILYDERRGGTIIEAALTEFYARFRDEEKLMADFIDVLEAKAAADMTRSADIRLMAVELRDRCINGSYASYFAHPTNVHLASDKILFNLEAAPNGDHKTYAMYLAMSLCYDLASATRNRKLLVIDEAWRLFRAEKMTSQSASISETLLAFAKESRHWAASVLFCTQSLRDFPHDASGEKGPLVNLVNTWVMMKQNTSSVETAISWGIIPGEEAIKQLIQEDENTSDQRARTDNKPRQGLLRKKGGAFVPFYSVALGFERREVGDKSGIARDDDDLSPNMLGLAGNSLGLPAGPTAPLPPAAVAVTP